VQLRCWLLLWLLLHWAHAVSASACSVETKEVRLRPVTEPHDYEVKVKAAKGFLAKGSKVKLTMQFNGREMRFKDQGKEMMLVRMMLG
jgi:translation initiation factor IF-3